MDRKRFLKTVCGLGVCGCVASLVDAPEALAAAPEQVPDQRLAFNRYQVAKMVGFMAAGTTAPACAEVLQKTGRECAKLGQINVKFKGDPDGYFAAARKAWGTDFSWDKEKGIITVAVAEGECSCPAGGQQANAGLLLQLLGRVPAGSLRGSIRKAGPGVAQGIEARRQQAVRLSGYAVADVSMSCGPPNGASMDASTKTPRVADFLLSWDRLGFRLLVFGGLALAWILQGLLAGLPWQKLVLTEVGGLMPWAFLAPMVLALDRRIQGKRFGAGGFLGAHLLGMVLVFVPYWLTLRTISLVWKCSESGWKLSQLEAFVPTTMNLVGAFLSVPFVYFLILLGAAAMKHAQARQEEEIQAGRLARQLSDARLALLQRQLHPHFPLQRAPGDLDAAPPRSRHRRSAPRPPVRPAAGDARRRVRADAESRDGAGPDPEVPGDRAGAGSGTAFASNGAWTTRCSRSRCRA